MFTDGFRKVIGAEQGGLRSEKDEWEFFNGNFNKYHPELLENVKRKVCALFKVRKHCLFFFFFFQADFEKLNKHNFPSNQRKLSSGGLNYKKSLQILGFY